ncbi:hypothetical protein BASA81_004361 [Batrachochytrium salamandrivorans]|nr:hypothetical protein BASA81_004361 [Batrachochytrium salamandrivorans]
MPANTQEGVPPTPFARALLRVCGQVFASATIPRAWLCASIVSIDKKDGDPLNPGDKRGIALINVGLKLAGFRKREECVGQVVSLVDIIQRRQNAGLNTHVLFIDIRKAFDTVPVGALLWKLQNMGFPRRTLAFLKALYTSSSARARAGSLLSDPFPSLDYRETPTPSEDSCTQTMLQCLLTLSNHCWLRRLLVEQWANQWEMQFGVAKCGIISFTGHLAPRLDNPLDIRLHGQLVSRVESYKYLGVLIDSKLDHSAWLKQKRSALEHTISALHPVLANHQLTVNYRSRIFSAVVMGKAYYGLELSWWQQVTPCTTADDNQQGYSAHPLLISWWSVNKVTGHRIQSGLVPAIQKSRLRLLGRALDPGVENVYTWLRGGVLNGEADLDQRWLDGTVEHESMGTRHDNRALAARLADFLQVAYRQYQSTLWKYHRDRLVEVG